MLGIDMLNVALDLEQLKGQAKELQELANRLDREAAYTWLYQNASAEKTSEALERAHQLVREADQALTAIRERIVSAKVETATFIRLSKELKAAGLADPS